MGMNSRRRRAIKKKAPVKFNNLGRSFYQAGEFDDNSGMVAEGEAAIAQSSFARAGVAKYETKVDATGKTVMVRSATSHGFGMGVGDPADRAKARKNEFMDEIGATAGERLRGSISRDSMSAGSSSIETLSALAAIAKGVSVEEDQERKERRRARVAAAKKNGGNPVEAEDSEDEEEGAKRIYVAVSDLEDEQYDSEDEGNSAELTTTTTTTATADSSKSRGEDSVSEYEFESESGSEEEELENLESTSSSAYFSKFAVWPVPFIPLDKPEEFQAGVLEAASTLQKTVKCKERRSFPVTATAAADHLPPSEQPDHNISAVNGDFAVPPVSGDMTSMGLLDKISKRVAKLTSARFVAADAPAPGAKAGDKGVPKGDGSGGKRGGEVWNGKTPLTPYQQSLLPLLLSYQDIMHIGGPAGEDAEKTTCIALHALNHILSAGGKVRQNDLVVRVAREERKHLNSKERDNIKDQPFTKAKVLICTPTRHHVFMLLHALRAAMPHHRPEVSNYNKFLDEFGPTDEVLPAGRPDDFNRQFLGNSDDCFTFGLSFDLNGIKTFVPLHEADLVICSPLGMHLLMEREHSDAYAEVNALSGIEVAIFDSCEMMLMQNWELCESVAEELNCQVDDPHSEMDISRLHPWCLNDWQGYFRQTVVFSSVAHPSVKGLFSRTACSWRGKIKSKPFIPEGGELMKTSPLVSQSWQRVPESSISTATATRFQFFTKRVWASLGPISQKKGTLVYVPDYLDFVQVRGHLVKYHEAGLVVAYVSEYTDYDAAADARVGFRAGEIHVLVVSERWYHFNRMRVAAASKLIFYAPPTFPHFYTEFINSLEGGNSAKSLALFSRFDIAALERICGPRRAKKYIKSSAPLHSVN